MRSRVLLAALLVSTAVPDSEARDYASFNASVVDGFIVPGYRQHAAATRSLADVVEQHCAGSGAPVAVADAYHGAMDAWQRIQVIVFGPIESGAGPARVQFWPDRRGSGARQLRRVVAAKDPSVLAPGALAGKSVALGDFQALERMLFGSDATIAAPGSYRCSFATAIARHQAAVATELLEEWVRDGGYRHLVLTAGPGNPRYREPVEPARDMMRSVVSMLYAVESVKIARPRRRDAERPAPKRAESWRSGRSLRNIVLNMESVLAIVTLPGGLGDLLKTAGGTGLADDLRERLAQAISNSGAIHQSLGEAVANATSVAHIDALSDTVKSLRGTVSGSVAKASGLLVGFNATDGD